VYSAACLAAGGIIDTSTVTLRLHLEDPVSRSCQTEVILRTIESSTMLLCAVPPLTQKRKAH